MRQRQLRANRVSCSYVSGRGDPDRPGAPPPPQPLDRRRSVADVEQKLANDDDVHDDGTFLWLNERLATLLMRAAAAHPYFSGTAERRAPATTRNVSRLWIIHGRSATSWGCL